MHPKFVCSALCMCVHMAMAQAPANTDLARSAAVSESDYLQDLPTVISVSRLAQPLADTPGAVTLLDREFIRMSGARDVVDLLRYVPGFHTTSSFETDAPMATYHGRNDDYANRIQVLVDGRSVYSGLLQGSAGIGWRTLALDDIERIEVLRGSNSATYGARAFLGVVNIVSRDVRSTLGAAVTATQGENNVTDRGLRLGWSAGDAAFRLSVDSTSDDGLQGAFGKNHTERLNLSTFVPIQAGTELVVRAGGVGVYAGRGEVGNIEGNAARMWFVGSQFVQGDLHHVLSDASDLTVTASHTHMRNRDRFLFMTPGAYFMAPIDYSGDEQVDSVTAQYALRVSPALRTVVGAEYRGEEVVSRPLFDVLGSVRNDSYRLFGSAEWHLGEAWLLNAGALIERNDFSGESFSPRLMLNWSVQPGHTLRAGASTAFRPPSAYERYGQRRYYDANGQNPTPYYTFNDGTTQPERLLSKELGYNFAPPGLPISGDVRVFSEHVSDGIVHTEINGPGVQTERYINAHQDQINGVEWQFQWTPRPATRLMLTQSWTQIDAQSAAPGNSVFRTQHGTPRYAASLALMHRLDSGLQLSLMHQQADDVALMSTVNRALRSMQRTDVRVAQAIRVGGTKAEVALVVQNLNDPYRDGDNKFYFNRRALLSLRFEY